MSDELLQIYSRIIQIKREIIEKVDPSIMVLNPEVQALYKEWAELQEKCTHIYENGKCTVCGKEEK